MSKFFTRVLPKSIGGLVIIACHVCLAQANGGSPVESTKVSELVPYGQMAIIPNGTVAPSQKTVAPAASHVAVPQRLPNPTTAQEQFAAQQKAAAERFAAQQKFASEQFSRMQQQLAQQQYGGTVSAVQPATTNSNTGVGTVAPGNFVQQQMSPQVQQVQHTIGTVGRKLSQYVNQAVAPPVRPADTGDTVTDTAAQAVKKAAEAVKEAAASTVPNTSAAATVAPAAEATQPAAPATQTEAGDATTSAANCSAGCSTNPGYPGYQAMPGLPATQPAGVVAAPAVSSAPAYQNGYAMAPAHGYQMPTCQMPGCTVEGCQMPGHLMPWLRNGVLGRGQLAQPLGGAPGLMLGQGQLLHRPLLPALGGGCTGPGCTRRGHRWMPEVGFPELSFPTITIPGFTIPGISFGGQGCSTPGCSTEACSGDAGCSSESAGCTCSACANRDQWNFGGWFQQGYHENSNGLFNNRPGRWNQHQLWFYAEREARPTNGQWDWGFRFDLVYGIDAQDTQAFGNTPGTWYFQNGFDFGSFGWAIPQLYF